MGYASPDRSGRGFLVRGPSSGARFGSGVSCKQCKPPVLVEIDRTVAQLRKTMGRNSEKFPTSLRNQLSKLVGHCARMHLQNLSYVHPGMRKMADWGECSERQARSNFAALREEHVIVPLFYEKGGRRATRFRVDFVALKASLVRNGANPHPTLLARLERFLTPPVRGFDR